MYDAKRTTNVNLYNVMFLHLQRFFYLLLLFFFLFAIFVLYFFRFLFLVRHTIGARPSQAQRHTDSIDNTSQMIPVAHAANIVYRYYYTYIIDGACMVDRCLQLALARIVLSQSLRLSIEYTPNITFIDII